MILAIDWDVVVMVVVGGILQHHYELHQHHHHQRMPPMPPSWSPVQYNIIVIVKPRCFELDDPDSYTIINIQYNACVQNLSYI